MRNRIILPCIFYLIVPGILFLACVPEQEKITLDPDARLRFSSDSVNFDTVFTAVNSITRRLKVYNDSKNAVEISRISLEGANTSPFRLTVNGVIENEHQNIRLLGEDSLLVLVDVLIEPMDEDLPFLITDLIQFETNQNIQGVNLVAYGQDANFINGQVLDCNTIWTADRPYVIYNSMLVDSLCTLTIEPGTKIYSHNASYIFIQGSLKAQGSVDFPILFSNDRFDENFIDAPGQWGGIVLLEGSSDNMMDHVRIRNARVGIYAGTPDENSDPDLLLSNSIIENMGGAEALPSGNFEILPGFGILGFNSDIYAYNVLINNCEIQSIGHFAGGNYRYEHCTFATYSFDFFRQEPGVFLADNLILPDDALLQNPLSFTLLNSIVWGSLSDEINFSITDEEASEINITQNLIRTNAFADLLGPSNQINTDPRFEGPESYNYRLMENSPAIDQGLPLGIINDLEGNTRDENPDLGAYEKLE